MHAAVIYWSGTGNTESMANLIAQGLETAGVAADVLSVSECSPEMIDSYGLLAFGCPAMGDEELEESEFEPFFSSVIERLKGKRIALFGSYGWGDGQWMRSWEAVMAAHGIAVFEKGFIVQDAPTADDMIECREFGQRFAKSESN